MSNEKRCVYVLICDNGLSYDDYREWVDSVHDSEESIKRYLAVYRTYRQTEPKKENFKTDDDYRKALGNWRSGFPKKYREDFCGYEIEKYEVMSNE